jgi:hypothetical protein
MAVVQPADQDVEAILLQELERVDEMLLEELERVDEMLLRIAAAVDQLPERIASASRRELVSLSGNASSELGQGAALGRASGWRSLSLGEGNDRTGSGRIVELRDRHHHEAVTAVASRGVDRVEILEGELSLLGALRIRADDADQQHDPIVARGADGSGPARYAEIGAFPPLLEVARH